MNNLCLFLNLINSFFCRPQNLKSKLNLSIIRFDFSSSVWYCQQVVLGCKWGQWASSVHLNFQLKKNRPVGHLMIPLLNWWLIHTHNNGFTAWSSACSTCLLIFCKIRVHLSAKKCGSRFVGFWFWGLGDWKPQKPGYLFTLCGTLWQLFCGQLKAWLIC